VAKVAFFLALMDGCGVADRICRLEIFRVFDYT
jgi:hypothetical protein